MLLFLLEKLVDAQIRAYNTERWAEKQQEFASWLKGLGMRVSA
jgi:hypothetical protein